MSEVKSTPGPWSSAAMPNDPEFTHKISCGKDTIWICDISNQANDHIRLITAAPELLEALQALVEHGTDSPEHLAAERAIAKATGSAS